MCGVRLVAVNKVREAGVEIETDSSELVLKRITIISFSRETHFLFPTVLVLIYAIC